MSELKARHIVDVYDSYNKNPFGERSQVYLKSEADKVIAEKDAEIARLKDIRKVHVEAIESMGAGLLQDVDEIHHQKYKRCLAIAKWCLTEKVYFHYRYDDWGDRGYDRPYKWKKVVFWSKWARRWLELAEKFKEAK